jgi:ketosteroid isomerase-like protein
MKLQNLVAYEQIRHTLAAYNHAGDSNDAHAYAATFTEDAIFEAPGFRLCGRLAIYDWKMKHTIFAAAAFRIHHVSSVLIDLISADTAKARSNWLVTTNIGTDHAGRYRDLFRKSENGWCIAHRQVDILWRAHNSFLGEEQMTK